MAQLRKLFLALLLAGTCYADGISSRLNIKTENGSVNTYPYQARFSNGSLTDNGDGTVSITASGGGGGTSSLGINFNGVSITSPTAQINFVGPGVSVVANGSTSTVTISSWPAGGGGGISSGTIVQTIISSVTSSSTTTSAIYVNTDLSGTITAQSVSDWVVISVNGPVGTTSGILNLTIARAGVSQGPSGGFLKVDPGVTLLSADIVPGSFIFIDTTPTLSAVTYTVQMKVSAGTGQFGDAAAVKQMILQEINPSGGTSSIVNAGAAGQLAYYAAAGTAISPGPNTLLTSSSFTYSGASGFNTTYNAMLGSATINNLSASLPVQTDGSKNLISAATFTAPITFTSSVTATSVIQSTGVYVSSATVGFDEFANGTYAAISTVTWQNSNKQRVTLSANTTFLFVAPAHPANLILRIATGSGGFTASWPGTVKWSAGSAPTITATASKNDIIACYYASDGNYYCVASQNF